MEALFGFEQAVAVFDAKYGKPLNDREKITAVRYIMPPQVFAGGGQHGLFRGRRVESYDAMRDELTRYIEDKPVPTVNTSRFSRDLNTMAEELQAVLQGGDPEAICAVLGNTELDTMYKKIKGRAPCRPPPFAFPFACPPSRQRAGHSASGQDPAPQVRLSVPYCVGFLRTIVYTVGKKFLIIKYTSSNPSGRSSLSGVCGFITVYRLL